MQDKARHGTNHWLNQTHCKHGHEFSPENTAYTRGGRKRSCRTCRSIAGKKRREARSRRTA